MRFPLCLLVLAAAFSLPALASPITLRVSVATDGSQGNEDSGFRGGLAVSADGRFVAFHTFASNLVPGDTNATWDVFLRDTEDGTTRLVSVSSDGSQGKSGSYYPSVSADGRFVVFDSISDNLVEGDVNGASDVFVRDTVAGATRLVSLSTEGAQGNQSSINGVISADGRFVAFTSRASNLVAGDAMGTTDVFLRDLVNGVTSRVSVTTEGLPGDDTSWWPSISADGRTVTFLSYAGLDPRDSWGTIDVYVRDTVEGITSLVSESIDGLPGNSISGLEGHAVSPDGRYVAFTSLASNLVAGDTNRQWDVFVRDTAAGTTVRVSTAWNGSQTIEPCIHPTISAHGHHVAFATRDLNILPDSFPGTYTPCQIYVRDLMSNTTKIVSVRSSTRGDADSYNPRISADGRYVAFESYAANLVEGDTNARADVFIHGPLFAVDSVNMGDVALALRFASGLEAATPASAFRADIDTDGKVGMDDVAALLRRVTSSG